MLTSIFVGAIFYFALFAETKNRKIAFVFGALVAGITGLSMTFVTLTAPMLAVAVAVALALATVFSSIAVAVLQTAITASAAVAAFLFIIS